MHVRYYISAEYVGHAGHKASTGGYVPRQIRITGVGLIHDGKTRKI